MPSKKPKALHESTLNFKKTKSLSEFPINFRRLHIRESQADIVRMIQPRGIKIKGFGQSFHKNRLIEGTLVIVYCDERSTNILDQRTTNELDEFISSKLHIIRDDPEEIKDQYPGTKYNVEITNDKIADNAYNLEKDKATGKIFGNI